MKFDTVDSLAHQHVFVETFPWWVGPQDAKKIGDYRAGDRVINLNSQQRIYVPFGLRGTVVGVTYDQIIVVFDE